MITIKKVTENLAAGGYDETLAHLYCRDQEHIAPYKERIAHLLHGYQDTFGKGEETEISVCSAAGRTEIGGNHTDHQRGRVLTGSVDLDALACTAANGTGKVRIFSEGFGMTEIDITSLEAVKEEENTTASLIRGIVAKLSSMGYPVSGFDAYVISDVPGGSGLSSSACFEILVGVVVNHLFCKDEVSLVEIAKIGQYAENVYFGKPSGLMDQMGCGVGGIVTIDFKDKENPQYHAVDVDFSAAGYALCIVDSGADHADLTADYASIPAEMKGVAAVFGKEVLSEVPEDEFYAGVKSVREKLGDRAVLRAIHYYNDCRRVEQQVAALEKKDFDTFLRLVRESGESSFTYLQNIATFRKAEDQPVAFALAMAEHALAGRGAYRVHGGGFAGTIQAFVPVDLVDAFKTQMDAVLGDGACRVTFIRPVGGCVLIK
jgi:galactokinase